MELSSKFDHPPVCQFGKSNLHGRFMRFVLGTQDSVHTPYSYEKLRTEYSVQLIIIFNYLFQNFSTIRWINIFIRLIFRFVFLSLCHKEYEWYDYKR